MSLSPGKRTEVSVLVRRHLRDAGFIDITAHGHSMYPYIKGGDLCRFVSVDPLQVHAGDVILYETASGQLIGHRVWAILNNMSSGLDFMLRGDTNQFPDQPMNEGAVLGRLITITRGRRTMVVDSVGRRIWSWMVLHIPMITVICRNIVFRKMSLQRRLQDIRSTASKEDLRS